jgi:hypothetical protein
MAPARRSDGARWLALLVVVACLCLEVGSAHAEPYQSEAPAWLASYQAAPACPDGRAFAAAVEGRRTSFAAQGETLVRVSVAIERVAASTVYSGVVEVSDGAQPTRRQVEGAGCAEVAEALSLIAAMGLDAGTPAAAGGASSDVAPVHAVESDRGAAPEAAPVTEAAQESLRLGVGALAVAHGAAAPGAALGVGGALALEWHVGAWQPALLVSAFRATGEDVLVAGAVRARFELLAGAAQLCPLRFPWRGPWALRPCLELELGQLSGTSSGSAVLGATTRSGVWSSAGVGVRGDADVWGPLRISASIAAVAPLARHEYTFSPDTTTAFRVPPVDWRATGLVGVFF